MLPMPSISFLSVLSLRVLLVPALVIAQGRLTDQIAHVLAGKRRVPDTEYFQLGVQPSCSD